MSAYNFSFKAGVGLSFNVCVCFHSMWCKKYQNKSLIYDIILSDGLTLRKS